jgi:hypothetical protein
MANNSVKVSALVACTNPQSSDKLLLSSNTSGNVKSMSLDVNVLFGNTSANVVLQTTTPANSTITVTQGTVFYDADYLYVATANNTLKRVSLSTF